MIAHLHRRRACYGLAGATVVEVGGGLGLVGMAAARCGPPSATVLSCAPFSSLRWCTLRPICRGGGAS